MSVLTEVDPLDHYTSQGAPLTWCVNACGLLPSFIEPESTHLLITQMEDNYGFPVSDLGGLVVEGIYTYPRDEDLYPYMSFKSGSETLYIYPYGIVASVYEEDGEQTQVSYRMD